MTSIEEIKLSDYKSGEYNPRVITPENKQGLRNSIKKFGLVQPIIVNKQTGNVVGGNQRFSILKEKELETTQAVVVDLTLDDEKALNLTLNNPGIQGEFKYDVNEILNKIKEASTEDYDSLRLFTIETAEDIAKDAKEKTDDPIPEMGLQPFEHYDYVLVMSDTVQDWYWLQEFFKLDKVNVSPVGNKRMGIGRAVKVDKFREILNELQNSNTEQKKTE